MRCGTGRSGYLCIALESGFFGVEEHTERVEETVEEARFTIVESGDISLFCERGLRSCTFFRVKPMRKDTSDHPTNARRPESIHCSCRYRIISRAASTLLSMTGGSVKSVCKFADIGKLESRKALGTVDFVGSLCYPLADEGSER